MAWKGSIGRTCPQGHVVEGDNLRIVGTRAVCIPCQVDFANKSRLRVKQQVHDAYGNQCSCCGETEVEFLCLDHVGGGGNEHRRSLNGRNSCGGYQTYRQARNAGFPDMYQLLCWNCNYGATLPGGCPHKRK